MANILEYTLTLNDKITGKLKQIGIANSKQLEVWAKVQQRVASADNTLQKCGVSVGSLRERVEALRAEREWIPANQINTIRRSNIEIKGLERQIRRLESVNGGRLKAWFANLKSAVPMVGMITNPLLLMGAAIYKVGRFINDSQEAWNIQMQGEIKLATVMRQRVKASDAEIESIKRLASAQQAIGVIGDEVQLSGAQQLATFISRKDSLDSLIPAMNNLLAQQKGLNATDQDAVNIGNLMGKVLQGQTSALTRVGITFTAAEEKILKYGNEQQRAATLALVINNNVGQMNQALANTPEGKLKQHANTMGDLQERVGQLYTQVKASLLPIFEWFGNSLEGTINWLDRNRTTVLTVVNVIAKAFKGTFSIIGGVIGGVASMFGWWIDKLREGNRIVIILTLALSSIATAMTLFTLKAKLMAVWSGIITTAKWAWAAAQNGLNLALLACPLTWFVAAIIALIGAIAYVAYTTEGWGETWNNTWEWIKLSFEQAGEWLHLKWLQVENFFLNGFETIQKGWYKLQSLWDKDGAQKGLNKIQSDRDSRAAEIAKAQGKIDELAARRKQIDIWQVKSNGKSLSDVTRGLKKSLGIEAPAVPGMSPVAGGGGSGIEESGTGMAGSSTAESIATGGSRSSSITINLKSLVEKIVFEGGYEGSRDNMEKDLESALIRVLQMANSAQ